MWDHSIEWDKTIIDWYEIKRRAKNNKKWIIYKRWNVNKAKDIEIIKLIKSLNCLIKHKCRQRKLNRRKSKNENW
jgi:hypothetical protein